MKAIQTLTALAAIAMAGTQAAPTKTSDMQCHRVKGPTKLTTFFLGVRNFESRTDVGILKTSAGRYLLHDDKNTDDRFEFFQCDSPPKGFNTTTNGESRGQIRSEKHPDKCLTVGGVDNRPHIIYNPDLPDGRKDGGFEEKNGILSLEPCSEDPRLQWWSLHNNGTSYIGSEKDTERFRVGGFDDVLYVFSVKNPQLAPHHLGYTPFLEFF
ncbi:hypothetical protein MCAP1_001971 [Malassezia caprae]|uniref:Ricin B lectin domain-containing protein n=1 Tax=Malassezia caprae TaxID=1381934 RepID=A0AAF0J073_9BASI|nr:hypothetical protein MCAP1_001971 [Malassezia caprae]